MGNPFRKSSKVQGQVKKSARSRLHGWPITDGGELGEMQTNNFGG